MRGPRPAGTSPSRAHLALLLEGSNAALLFQSLERQEACKGANRRRGGNVGVNLQLMGAGAAAAAGVGGPVPDERAPGTPRSVEWHLAIVPTLLLLTACTRRSRGVLWKRRSECELVFECRVVRSSRVDSCLCGGQLHTGVAPHPGTLCGLLKGWCHSRGGLLCQISSFRSKLPRCTLAPLECPCCCSCTCTAHAHPHSHVLCIYPHAPRFFRGTNDGWWWGARVCRGSRA